MLNSIFKTTAPDDVITKQETFGDDASSKQSEKLAELQYGNFTSSLQKPYSSIYLFRRLALVNRDCFPLYVPAFIACILTGAEYPAFGLVFGIAISIYQTTPDTTAGKHVLRVGGNHNALWYFIIALGASIIYTAQNYLFTRTASTLGHKVRILGFRSILRQDGGLYLSAYLLYHSNTISQVLR